MRGRGTNEIGRGLGLGFRSRGGNLRVIWGATRRVGADIDAVKA